jgi:DMSO/TMAO reductase YedYZ molybdopterin-dependent catalytic subunit
LTVAGLGAQSTPITGATTLGVTGDVAKPLTLSEADLKALPRTRVEIKEEGRTLTYEGVLVGEILKAAGAPVGGGLRGAALATYVVATGSDGYAVVFSLAELDPGFVKNDIIVADSLDGKPLVAAQGPFRIVAPRDERPARSVRMLASLNVVRLSTVRGKSRMIATSDR